MTELRNINDSGFGLKVAAVKFSSYALEEEKIQDNLVLGSNY